jgi:alpha-L-rhamnosidase
VQWTTDDGVLTLTAAVPPGTSAEVRLPGEPAAVVGPGTHSFLAAVGGVQKPELVRSTL